MAVIPIQLPEESVHIHADRRLAFQFLTAFRNSRDESAGHPRVVEEDGDRLLVEFVTPVRLLFGLTVRARTREWVRFDEPHQIDFELAPEEGLFIGGLKLLNDRFLLEDTGGCTEFHYQSTFGIRWSFLGWLLGKLWIQWPLRKHMRDHLSEVKQAIEARAARSRVYPLVDCGAPQTEGGP